MSEPRTAARALLARHGLRPKKSWGQNFLQDAGVITRIVKAAQIAPGDVVVEIGPGLGALTAAALETGAQVIAVERDPDMVNVLRADIHEPRLLVQAVDAMAFDLGGVGDSIVVLGNLPYQITSPLLFKILAAGPRVRRAVLMVQREVAERVVAPPGSKTYGRLSVMVQQAADVEILFHVGAHAFFPQPNVTSTVFALTPRAVGRAPGVDGAMFAAVVRSAFAGRRKMLRRSLGDAFGDPVAAAALQSAEVAATRRAEELSVEEFGRIAGALTAAGAASPAATEDEDA